MCRMVRTFSGRNQGPIDPNRPTFGVIMYMMTPNSKLMSATDEHNITGDDAFGARSLWNPLIIGWNGPRSLGIKLRL